MDEASERRPLGIFGGTFDPIHFGHLRLAEEAIEALALARVRWIPAGQPALRNPPRVEARERLAMVRLAIAGNPRFELDAGETESQQASYTVPTLERLRQPEVCGERRPLVLLVGADAFAGLPDWHRWEDLLALTHIGVAHRPGYSVETSSLPSTLARIFAQRRSASPAELADSPAGRIALFTMTPLAISATQIRTLCSAGQSLRYLLPEPVIAHIHRHRFYSEN